MRGIGVVGTSKIGEGRGEELRLERGRRVVLAVVQLRPSFCKVKFLTLGEFAVAFGWTGMSLQASTCPIHGASMLLGLRTSE